MKFHFFPRFRMDKPYHLCMQSLPVNRTATDLSAAYNDVIVGNAILLGTTDEDFIGLTERAAQNIMKKWELGVC